MRGDVNTARQLASRAKTRLPVGSPAWVRADDLATIKLANAIITNLRTWFPNCLDDKTSTYGHMEEVSFTYEKIVWTWVPDGIEAEDDWAAPKS